MFGYVADVRFLRSLGVRGAWITFTSVSNYMSSATTSPRHGKEILVSGESGAAVDQHVFYCSCNDLYYVASFIGLERVILMSDSQRIPLPLNFRRSIVSSATIEAVSTLETRPARNDDPRSRPSTGYFLASVVDRCGRGKRYQPSSNS